MWSTSGYRPVSINYWPSFLDVLIAALMVFVLSTYVQVVLQAPPPETAGVADEVAKRLHDLRQDFLRQLREDLSAEIADGSLTATDDIAFVHLRFNAKILFATGDYHLNESGKKLLAHLGAFLAKAYQPGVQRILVQGYTDDRPFNTDTAEQNIYPSDNWQLSSARATEVTRFLIALPDGPPESLFSATGNASNRPLLAEPTEEARSRNRRVEIDLLFVSENQAGP